METKKNSSRGRPRKDYGELKNKLAQEAAENKGKLSRGRPKKQRNIEDSINTKISNHQKDVSALEKKNKEIHENIKKNEVSDGENNLEVEQYEKTRERYSRIALLCSMIFCIFAIGYYYYTLYQQKHYNLNISEANSSISNNIEEGTAQMQIGYNNENGDFVEVEKINIIDNEKGTINNAEIKDNSAIADANEVDNSDVALIRLFYDKVNNREFSELSSITDRYLKNSDSYKTYFSSNWLNNFLDKIVGNKVFVGGFTVKPSNKPDVNHYGYIVKYRLNNESSFRQEDREIAIVERNGEKLIGSIMCVTTGCSRMPFFQK